MQNCLNFMKENMAVQDQTIRERDKIIHQLRKNKSEEINPEFVQEQFRNVETERLRAEADSDFFRTKCEELTEKIAEMQKKLDQSECFKVKYVSLKGEFHEISEKIDKKEETIKLANQRFSHLVKKIDQLVLEKKSADEKIGELEVEKRKILEKWQKYGIFSSIGRIKEESQVKGKVKELELLLDSEKAKSENYLQRLKEISGKCEELKEACAREKSYSEEIAGSYKKLHVQTRVLIEEKELLSRMNQELSVKFHMSTSEKPLSSISEIKEQQETIEGLREELAKAYEIIKNKSQELLQIEFTLSEVSKNSRKAQKSFNHDENYLIAEKYDALLEKYKKIQSEKNQIQGLYVGASSTITEKNCKIQDLEQKISELEEKLLFFGKKSLESSKIRNPSLSNLGTSRSTCKSSPKRCKTPGDNLLSSVFNNNYKCYY